MITWQPIERCIGGFVLRGTYASQQCVRLQLYTDGRIQVLATLGPEDDAGDVLSGIARLRAMAHQPRSA